MGIYQDSVHTSHYPFPGAAVVLSFPLEGISAVAMPKGSLQKYYHPKGILKIINLAPFGCKAICQKPLVESKRENTWALILERCHPMWVGWISLQSPLFSWFRSMCVLTVPFFLCPINTGTHHSVGSEISSVTPHLAIWANSSFTVGSIKLKLLSLSSCYKLLLHHWV